MSEHTPPPWLIEPAGSDRGFWIHAPAGDTKKEHFLPFSVSGRTPAEAKANANLCASAPDLLEACKAAYADQDAHLRGAKPPMHTLKLTALLRAAIAKATPPTSRSEIAAGGAT